MMRLASASRVTIALSSAASVLPDLCSTYHAVSNADLNVSIDSGSKSSLLRRGSIGIAALVGACVVVCNLQKLLYGRLYALAIIFFAPQASVFIFETRKIMSYEKRYIAG